MRPIWKGYVPQQHITYIELLLGHIQPEGKEAGLEQLCKWHRRGYRIKSPHCIQQTLNALLYHTSPKVRRWTFNTIALVGSREVNLSATLDALHREGQDEDVIGAGVAAAISLARPNDVVSFTRSIGVSLEGAILLAAAQQSTSLNTQVADHRVNPDRAGAAELRMATILVGLEKAPEFLFTSSHPNSTVIGSLNEHNDPLVAQYSVWAICENPTLTVSNLGTRLQDIDSRPENVRGWIYQLIASDANSAVNNREYILHGSEDLAESTRLGLATGFQSTYFDGLEEITTDWFAQEPSEKVKSALLDHMASFSERCGAYRESVVDAYREANTGSLTRARLEAITQKTSLYGDLRRIAIDGEDFSLFGKNSSNHQGIMIMNNSGNINVGVMANGDVNITGNVQATQHNAINALECLKQLSELLAASTERDLSKGVTLTEEAIRSPTKSTISKVLEWMKAIKDVGGYIVAGTESFGKIFDQLSDISSDIL